MRLIFQLIYLGPQIYIAHQVNSDERDKVGHMPVVLCFTPEVLKQQYGYHCCPNLTHHGILIRSNKGFDHGYKVINPKVIFSN